jgi:hypothetical protein
LTFEHFHHEKSMNNNKTPASYYDTEMLKRINEKASIK